MLPFLFFANTLVSEGVRTSKEQGTLRINDGEVNLMETRRNDYKIKHNGLIYKFKGLYIEFFGPA